MVVWSFKEESIDRSKGVLAEFICRCLKKIALRRRMNV